MNELAMERILASSEGAMRTRIPMVAAAMMAFFALGGGALGQDKCIIRTKPLQFCFTTQAKGPCACSDWSGRRVNGDRAVSDSLRDPLREGWLPGTHNSEWLNAQASHFDNSPPPSREPLVISRDYYGRQWGQSWTGNSFLDHDRIRRQNRYPDGTEIVPIGPWPAPPGWPPK